MRILVITILLTCSSVFGDDLLSTLRKEHPRVLVLAPDFAKAKQNAMRDPRAGVYYKQIVSDCAKFMAQKPVVRGQGEMLNTSRTALGRITFLAALYRMDGDRKFAERARREMLAAAGFEDWNPSHFLDTAEMTAAMGIGYDWLFDALSPEDRATIRGAIIEKGLKPGMDAYKRGEWWTKVDYNWANVCAGGLAVGALAIADEEPDLARQVLQTTRHAMEKPLATLGPDGGCAEGPAYWDYGMRYTVFYLAAAETALGNDLGMAGTEGLDKTGLFRIYTNGPTDKAFNFADSTEFAGIASQMFWLAKFYHQPAFAVSEREYAAKWGDAFHLLWWDDQGTSLSDAKLPLDAIFRKANVASFRGAWDDRGTFFVGFKGGDNTTNHAHLDLGSFVLDAFGQRWAMDLGSDNYSLPDYFGKLRWTYYRTRTEGHNTLVVDDMNQDSKKSAPIVAFLSSPERALAVVDLSEAYHWRTSRVFRGIGLLNRSTVVVEDEVEAPKPVKVQWNFHTQAKIEIGGDGRAAELLLGGKELSAKILSPEGAKFDTVSTAQGKPQADNKGIYNLVVVLPEKVTRTRIVVVLARKDVIDTVKDVPGLEDWVKAGMLKDAKSN
jgi:Heparinase II/III-like protein